MSISLAELTAQHFEPLVGQGFKVRWPEMEETLTLQNIRQGKPAPKGFRQPFALTFHGTSKEVLLNQCTHPVEVGGLGELPMFLVPVGQNPDGTFQYEAVFS